jgi:HlyD family secretion protein
MKNKKIIPIGIVIVALISATLYFEVIRNLGENSDKIEGSGTIEVTEIEISSKISGRVAELPKPEGSDVKKGELIVKLDYDELNAQKISAYASLVNAEKNLGRTSKLYKSGSVSKQAYDNAETAYSIAKAGYEQISATIENAVIYSPISGTVLDTNLEVGEIAFPGTSVLTLADLTKPWIYVYVNERKLGFVKLGQKAYISVDSFPDRKFEGKVTAISNKAEFTPKTIQTKEERVKLVFAVKIAIENPDMSLKPGMPADAEIIITEEK